MLKFLYMGDRHNSESIPKSRIDNYFDSCEAKDNEIIKIANEHNVTAILHPGDFWTDSDRRIGNEFIAKIARRWMAAGIPLIGIAGNHDLIGNNEGSISSTTTGLLNSLGIFKTLSNGERVCFDDGGKTVVITGTGYHKGMDKKEFLSDYIVEEKQGDVHIHIVHGMLNPKSLGKIIRHTTIDEIKHTEADVTLCGHDHVGFGIVDYNGKLFINPGAVVRMTCDVKEIERTVGVVLLTVDDGKVAAEFIPLTSAKPGTEVLSREMIEEQSAKAQYRDFVKDGVNKLNVGNTLTVTDVLEEIYEEENIPEAVRKSIEKKMIEKRGSVKDKSLSAPEDADIIKIEIHNFQSHADTVIELDKKFNVIVGESHQGKSSILRAIRWVAEGKPTGKSIIRIGQTDAFVQITLRNSTIIRKFISAKENGYKVYLPNGETMEGNTRMVPQIQALMGWNNMPIGENEDIPLNHLRQGDSWYLIGDKYTSTDRARILGAINKTEGADAAIKDFDKENGRIADAIKREEIEIVNLAHEIQTAEEKKSNAVAIKNLLQKALMAQRILEYLNLLDDYKQKKTMLDTINACFDEENIRAMIKRVEEKQATHDRISGYIVMINAENARLSSINASLMQLSGIEEAAAKSVTVRHKIDRLDRVSDLCFEQTKASFAFKDALTIEQALNDIDEHGIANIKEKFKTVAVIENMIVSMDRATRSITAADKMLAASSEIDLFQERKERLSEKFRNLDRIISLLKERSVAETTLDECCKTVAYTTIEHDKALKCKLDILKDTHICPTCYAVITDGVIENIISKEKEHV